MVGFVETEEQVESRKVADKTTLWNLIVSAFAAPRVETRERDPPIVWCDAFGTFPSVWFADQGYAIAATPEHLQR